MGDTYTPMADSCECMAKPPQYCKIISLKLKLKEKLKKRRDWIMVYHFFLLFLQWYVMFLLTQMIVLFEHIFWLVRNIFTFNLLQINWKLKLLNILILLALFFTFIFVKNELLVSFIFSITFLVSIVLIYFLSFIISFLLLTLGFVFSSFSSHFRCKVMLLTSDFYCYLRKASISRNLPFRTAFPSSHKFWFSFSFVSKQPLN